MPIIPIRIARDTIPALMFGATLTIVAIGMAVNQWRQYRLLKLNVNITEAAYAHDERQCLRRLQVAGLLFLIGVLIPLGDQLDWFFRAHPEWFFGYWAGVLLLVLWVVMLALGDALVTMIHLGHESKRFKEERKSLQEELRRLQATRPTAASERKQSPPNDRDNNTSK